MTTAVQPRPPLTHSLAPLRGVDDVDLAGGPHVLARGWRVLQSACYRLCQCVSNVRMLMGCLTRWENGILGANPLSTQLWQNCGLWTPPWGAPH
jgi:hypothetical protein